MPHDRGQVHTCIVFNSNLYKLMSYDRGQVHIVLNFQKPTKKTIILIFFVKNHDFVNQDCVSTSFHIKLDYFHLVFVQIVHTIDNWSLYKHVKT